LSLFTYVFLLIFIYMPYILKASIKTNKNNPFPFNVPAKQ